MQSSITDSGIQFGQCGHCGLWHSGPCSRLKRIEYYPNGTIKAIEYHDGYSPLPMQPPMMPTLPTLPWDGPTCLC